MLGQAASRALASVPFPKADQFDAEAPTAWADLSLRLVRQTAGYTPPVASRAFAYAGLALFEALVPGIPEGRTLSDRLQGIPELPRAGRNREYDWPTVANAALADISHRLFATATADNHLAIDALERGFADRFRSSLPLGVFDRSVQRGRDVAAVIFEWSRSDGGHEAYLHNFPPYAPPAGPGLWVPTPPGFLPAMQPYWGSCRMFALPSGAACPPDDPTPYSEDPESRFFTEALEVYDAVKALTQQERDIAEFWSDDPGATPTPPGHSISILTQTMRARGSSLDQAAEAYAKVGIAVADAFICCWYIKYRVNLLRPVTYIRAHIDPAWSSLLVTPPFPDFTSGHSVQSGAAAQVMTHLFGQVAFTDHTHDDRGLTPRSFDSFDDAAAEAAVSRLYGGIHYRPAIDLGLLQGRCIGAHVSALQLRG